ncbi:creatininase family protein [Cohaesibacter celericrescens]|uniref:Creatininase n=1 Tax=Cohaesibacter celericrescens TaxID=2067669 RepID=A0A2N5XNL5_9HYPH|nr:creatininase family protein [Cohaesibacter celericrescens]PLW76094.1 creatininase [Cohaesibacter celericrescens]
MSHIKNHLLENMTFEEFRQWSEEDDCPVILIPLGSQEIQGPVVPMGDFMLARKIAEEVAERSNAVAAPTMPFGYAEYFRSVPGGIALSADTFKGVLRDILDNFLNHGFKRLVILNGHSGNYSLIDQVIRAVRRETGLIVPCINLWRSIPDEVWAEIHGEYGKKAFSHGGDPVTSTYMHYFPELTHADRAKLPETPGEMVGLPVMGLSGVKFKDIEIGMPINVDDRCPDGIVAGDPNRSSADKGEKIAEHLIGFCTDFVTHFRNTDPSDPKK